jgi:hypothetical protein
LNSQAFRPKAYDLVLVFTAFQRNCVYASVIKELAGSYRIAVLPMDRDETTLSRIGSTNRLFLDLCSSLGADILGDDRVTAHIAILAQSNYREEDVARIDAIVEARLTFWMSGVAMGNASYGNLFGKKIDRILVPDRRLYDHRIATYGNDGIEFPDHMIQEIGIPYPKYPLFDKPINVDYILANPTPFSFVTAEDRLDYLENVHALAREIVARGEVIAFKPHNADERVDYIVDARLLSLVSATPLWPLQGFIDAFARMVARLLPAGKARELALNISIAVAYRKLMALVVHLSELTPYYNLNLEVFLPDVRGGLITGRSNSIWHALFLKKPVWNCIDRDKPYASETKMHRQTMTYLNVHGNYRDKKFDETHYEVIKETTREVDLILYLNDCLSNK